MAMLPTLLPEPLAPLVEDPTSSTNFQGRAPSAKGGLQTGRDVEFFQCLKALLLLALEVVVLDDVFSSNIASR